MLAGMIHKERISPTFSKALAKLINLKNGKVLGKALTQPQQSALKEWRRSYLQDTAQPASFVVEFARLVSQSQEAWKSARAHNAFNQFAPFLEKLVDMSRKKADYLGYKDHPYDALLDLFEPNLTVKEIDPLFNTVQKSITTLLKKITAAKQIDDSCLKGKFSEDKQLAFSHIILKAMQYNLSNGRLDLSTHPFSSAAHPTDSRITTRLHTDSVIDNILTTLHEGGHALYEMGLPQEHYGTPLGDAISLGFHESQSRWWETRIGLSKPFWQHFYPLLQKTFKPKFDKVPLEQFYRAINKVEPGYIRVEADEVTYPLHVILRYTLEKQIIEGSLKVRDIPEAWNETMQKYLGITPPSNTLGCLQDVHWSMGAFGYFPTYALGNLYAAHMFPAFEKENPNWKDLVAKGDLKFIKDWLNSNIHVHGKAHTSLELLQKTAKAPFSPKPYINYLNAKYGTIYNLK
jgi:carboxypeptidase Taq